MATMFGRFEIQSELSRSETALVYKATDTETNQTVALKTQSLEPLGERAQEFVDTLIAESEGTRDLAGQNIALLYGAGEIDGQFCAAMEYVQGNSIATMLSRKEGFSIWDLVDITRQVCAGLDQAAAKGVVHYSLEPAKIMVQWDGLVKLLGYGISHMSLIEAEAGRGLGRLLPYCSPEQVRGESIDLRSNLFSWGAILYEMVAGRKAFDGLDPAVLVTQIQNEMPSSPSGLNPKVQAGISALIMKALAKDPEARYRNARELVEDLEKCKDNGRNPAADPKKAASAANAVASRAARTAATRKFVAASPKPAEPELPSVATPESGVQAFSRAHPPVAEKKSWAAAAGMASAASISHSPGSDSGARLMDEPNTSPAGGRTSFNAQLSATAFETETEASAPRIAIDPVMAGLAQTAPRASFSDVAELPPLKEGAYTPPSFPLYETPEPDGLQIHPKQPEKAKVQPREVAEKAIKEIKTVPPRLMLYSILGAVGLILIVALALFFHVRSEDDGSTAAPSPNKGAASQGQPVSPAPVARGPHADSVPTSAPEPEPEVTVRQFDKRAAKRAASPPVPVVIPGQVQIDSAPQGAQIQIDGKSDPSWVTPFNLTGLSPGKHMVSAGKAGYSAEIRSVDVASGSESFVVIHLSPSNALMAVISTPPGAEIVVDGKNTGRMTPAQFAVEKGSHTVVVRKPGFLEETTTADLGPGQNFQFAPALRALGNVDDIRTVGKFKKLFGKGGDSAAGMGSVSIRTQPKGAQIAINQRLLDKLSPVEIMLGPGNYVLDITLTGCKPLHKIFNVGQGGKVAIDEVLERE
ncbi:MAG TPA: PEGA domain-containing protein [Terriglobales bacterium]|nr:PEGA domain-containing protein [Terriglobales bacterium]